MKINIEEIKKSPQNELEINFSDYIDGLSLNNEVSAKLKATASEYGVNIRGNIIAELILQCDRCLENFVYEINTEINEEFITDSIVREDQKDYEHTDRGFAEDLNGREEIDIRDLIYQLIILELPNKNLCKADCKGIEGIQEETSKNNSEQIDERLEVFKFFSENNFSEKE